MKNKDRTIKAATFEKLDKRLSLAAFEIETASQTVSSYFGRNANLTKSWREALKQLREIRYSTRVAFKKKISN